MQSLSFLIISEHPQLRFLFIIANKQNRAPAVHIKKSHKQELYDFISSNHLNNISVTSCHAPFSLNISAGSITEFNSLLQISMLRFFYAWNYMYLRVFCSMYIIMYPQNHFFLIIIGTILVPIFNTIIFKIS
jgi:hypothetical protein